MSFGLRPAWPPGLALAGGTTATAASWFVDGAAAGTFALAWLTLLVSAVLGLARVAPAQRRDTPVHLETSNRRGPDPFAFGAVFAALGTAAAATVASTTGPGVRFLGWTDHPNLWAAHMAASSAVAIAVLARRSQLGAALVVASAAVLAVSATGSRTALLATIAAVGMVVLTERSTTRYRCSGLLLAMAAGVVVVAVSPLVDRLDLATRWGRGPAPSPNRLLASEELMSGFWTQRDVAVTRVGMDDGDAVHRIETTASDGLSRLHQRQVLPPGVSLSWRVEFSPNAPDAGLLAFGDTTGRLAVRRDGTILAAQDRSIRVVGVTVEALKEGWTRLTVAIQFDGPEAEAWRVGIAPTLVPGSPSSVDVRRPELVLAPDVSTYVGTRSSDRDRALAALSAAQRRSYVPIALNVAQRSPWVGHGREIAFHELAERHTPGRLAASDRPSHAHSFLLDLLVAHGAFGVVGVTAMGAAWWATLTRTGRRLAWPFLAAVLVSNVGDTTLLSGGPEYAALVLVLIDPGRNIALEETGHAGGG